LLESDSLHTIKDGEFPLNYIFGELPDSQIEKAEIAFWSGYFF